MATTSVAGLAQKFMQCFAGLSRAYGTYDLSRATVRDDGKQQGRAITKVAPVTEELWEAHLSGRGSGLGIVPIRDGDSCVFGAIDIDVYAGLDHRTLCAKIKRNNLPLIVCRSKSGGAHIYCFSKNLTPASTMISKLSEISAFLGYGDCEIFPKQSHILSDAHDVGSWINMPYFNGVRGMRYAIGLDGNALNPDAFLQLVGELAVSPEWFKTLLIVGQEFEDGPPCLQALAQIGYPDGTRNAGLYNIGVYLKKSHPDNWENDIDNYNHKYMEPPLTISDVQGVVNSLKKKDYNYGCSKQPIAQHCNAPLCRMRKFGVSTGSSGRFPMLGGLTKLNTKPPIWFWTIDGVRMELTTAELQDPRQFQRRCMEYVNMMPSLPNSLAWQAAVQRALDTLTTVDIPGDASPEGQLWEMIEKFCTSRSQALTIEEIVLGKPFTDSEKTSFRMSDLLAFLSRNKFFEFKSTKIASLLKDAGAEHHFTNLSGRGVNYWSIPAFARQKDPLRVPKEVDGNEAF